MVHRFMSCVYITNQTNVYVYIYIYIYIYAYKHILTYDHVYIYIYVYIKINMYIYIYTYAQPHGKSRDLYISIQYFLRIHSQQLEERWVKMVDAPICRMFVFF